MELYEDSHDYNDYDLPIRPRRAVTRCQCGDDLPGRCPGPMNCPYSGVDEPDEEDDDDAAA